jgi:organic radical activating enzyme
MQTPPTQKYLSKFVVIWRSNINNKRGNTTVMSKEIEGMTRVRERLNKVSSSFCLAKWLQVTIHLQNGQTHSCHHPATHPIPIDEIARDPSALHNTQFKKQQRKLMLEGKRPSECQYCWNIEDTSPESFSDRHIKSHDWWAEPQLEEIASLPWDANVYPSYLELSFSHVCNFKCSYCSPHVSSKWQEEIRSQGAYPLDSHRSTIQWLTSSNLMPIPESQENPFVTAFWKWWPDLYPKLKLLRITGGEPLLTKHTFRMLDYIESHPRPDLELAINTNLGAPKEIIDRFIEQVRRITEAGKVKRLQVYTSVDNWGARAEYIRHGLNFETFWRNVDRIHAEIPKVQMLFMCTFNALSIDGFQDLLEGILALRAKYIHKKPSMRFDPLFLDISYLRFPEHQSVLILPPSYVQKLRALGQFMDDHNEEIRYPDLGFFDFERNKIHRLVEWMSQPQATELTNKKKADFYRFFSEHDQRRGTDFIATFPEMTEFWQTCRQAASQ